MITEAQGKVSETQMKLYLLLFPIPLLPPLAICDPTNLHILLDRNSTQANDYSYTVQPRCLSRPRLSGTSTIWTCLGPANTLVRMCRGCGQ